uniref:Uncharacterized protein n=1 Tax=Panagrolaimus sp. JU765 TaxID=591449 RepID=A0AC34QN63_9BILA
MGQKPNLTNQIFFYVFPPINQNAFIQSTKNRHSTIHILFFYQNLNWISSIIQMIIPWFIKKSFVRVTPGSLGSKNFARKNLNFFYLSIFFKKPFPSQKLFNAHSC